MANYSAHQSSGQITAIFHALSDPTRRNILERLAQQDLTVSEIAKPYSFALPTISKHVTVLEKANLIKRHKEGREYHISFQPEAMQKIADYIAFYTKYWNLQLDQLEVFLLKEVKKDGK